MNGCMPISVKGILINSEGRVLLLKNERNYWELPGGRIEAGEQPEETVKREIAEETGMEVTVKQLVDAYVYEVIQDRHVFIVTYQCHFDEQQNIVISDEHREFAWFDVEKLNNVRIGERYLNSIQKALSGPS